MSSPTIAFCGGGSGGHVAPAVAIIEQLRQQCPNIHTPVFCSDRPIDRQMLSDATGDLPGLAWHKAVRIPRGAFPKRQLLAMLELFRGTLQMRSLLRQLQPAVVVGLGAFASIPGVMAARRLRIPTVLLEPNAVPGRATRFLSRRADRIFTGLPMLAVQQSKLGTQAEQMGVPVRAAVAKLAQSNGSSPSDRRVLLIIGGSQGAAKLNSLVELSLSDGFPLPARWSILHQTGVHDIARLREFYAARCLPAEVVEYLPDLPKRLPEIGLAVSRAGALTLAELACAGVPSILIPLSTAASGHQQKNALVLAQAGAAELVDETQSISEGTARLRSLLQELSHSELRRQQMSRAAHELARPDAAAAIARRLLEIAQRN